MMCAVDYHDIHTKFHKIVSGDRKTDSTRFLLFVKTDGNQAEHNSVITGQFHVETKFEFLFFHFR
jgi:hypothetical protein